MAQRNGQPGNLSGSQLTLCCPAGLDDPVGRWLEPLLAAWPAGWDRPGAQIATLGSIIHDPLPAAVADRPQGVLVAVLPDAIPMRDVYRLVRHARRTGRPAVFLFEQLDEPSRAIGDEGIIVDWWDIGADVLAQTIEVLVRRQPSVTRLTREVELADELRSGERGRIGTIAEQIDLAAAAQNAYLGGGLARVPGLDAGLVRQGDKQVRSVLCDVSCLDESLVRFYMADAMDTGTPAALLTLIIAQSLGQMRHIDTPVTLYHPGEALTQLNADLSDRTIGGPHRHATCIYGVLDVATGEARLAGAGHPAPLIVRADSAERVPVGGAVLGVENESTFEEMTIFLEPGDVLTLFSPGFESAIGACACPADHEKQASAVGCLHRAAMMARETGSIQTGAARVESMLSDIPVGASAAEDTAALMLGYRLVEHAAGRSAA